MAYGTIYSDTIQGSTANTAPVFKDGNTVEIGQLCKSWTYFNSPSSTVTVQSSFNTSSVTRGSAGVWTIYVTTAMNSSYYSLVGSSGGASNYYGDRQLSVYPNTSTNFNVVSGVTATVTVYDATNVCISVFR